MTNEQFDAIIDRLDRILELLEHRPPTLTHGPRSRIAKDIPMPKHGDPIDAWLDWREVNRKNIQLKAYCTLDAIAKASGHSVSTLKKKSALRKR